MLPGPNQTPARFSEVCFPSRSSDLSSCRLIHSTRYLYPLLLIRTNHPVAEKVHLRKLGFREFCMPEVQFPRRPLLSDSVLYQKRSFLIHIFSSLKGGVYSTSCCFKTRPRLTVSLLVTAGCSEIDLSPYRCVRCLFRRLTHDDGGHQRAQYAKE